jgi:tRNA pseudouridine38-40 synthase
MAVRNIKLTVSYDGSSYHGWQIQPDSKTVQGILAGAVSDLIGWPVSITGASRTDAGVSALGQEAAMQIDSPIPTENLAKAITQRLPDDIAVSEAVEMPADFDVISHVKSKLYRYTIFIGKTRPVLEIRHCWHMTKKPDIDLMVQGAGYMVGKKDFKSFASAADQRESSVRTVLRCDVTSDNDRIYIDVEGDGFLYNMVRNIVGTLVEVGLGRLKPGDIEPILDAKDRTAAGPIAPAAGLCLMWIKY